MKKINFICPDGDNSCRGGRVRVAKKLMEEAKKELDEILIIMQKNMPKDWNLHTWMCPIQYKKTVKIDKHFYGCNSTEWLRMDTTYS